MESMDRSAFEQHLDASLQALRQQLLEVYPAQPRISLPEPSDIQDTSDNFQISGGSERNPNEENEHDDIVLKSNPLLPNGLQNLTKKEADSVRNRLRLRLGILSSKQLVTGRSLLDAVSALGLTKYTEEEMNEFVNMLGEFIGLEFVFVQKRGSQASLNSWFSFKDSATSAELARAKPVWEWPKPDGQKDMRSGSDDQVRRRTPMEYDCVPATPLLEIFMSPESEVHKRIFGYRLNQYRAIREILVAGDTNRLVAELTFVRINDLAAPPEPMHPIMYLEPLVAVVIVANGVMIGFQTDPRYRDWPGWVFIEMAFAVFLVAEIILRMCWLGCAGYWCGPERSWNWFDIFLFTTGGSDIAIQLSGAPSDISGASLLRFCRLIRLVRIVKVFRVKFMRDLRLMVKGLLAGVRTLLLAFILLFTVLYVIAGFATMTVGSDERTAEIGLLQYFDTIPTSMFTAFRCFTGECISDDGRPLQSLLTSEYGLPFIIGYVSSYMLVTMGIFNVILAVYVDITMKAAKESDAMNAEQHARESIRVARTTRELLKIFSAAYHSFREHQSGDDEPMRSPSAANFMEPIRSASAANFIEDGGQDQVAITKELFLLIVQDNQVQKLMDDLDLPPDRANLFEMLDADGSGTLQTTELLQGLLKVRGEVNKSDTVASLLATKAVQNLVTDLKDQQATQIKVLNQTISQVQSLRAEVGRIVAPQRQSQIIRQRSNDSSPLPAPPRSINRDSRISSKVFGVVATAQPEEPLSLAEPDSP